MSAKKHLSVFDSYDRFYNGRKIHEDSWDYVIVPTNALAMKEKYDINFSEKIIPEDDDLCDRLFYAGVEMLSTTGFYNPDMGRVLTISEDEIYEGLRRAPKSVKLGSGKEEVVCRARKGNPGIKPVVEGGPTGAPVSEEVFVPLMRSYAQESTVDVLVSGILSMINKRPSTTNTPNEIRATLAEIRNVREASVLSGRPGLGIQGPQTPLSAAGRLSSGLTPYGLKPHDPHEVSQLNELKIDMAGLNMIAGWVAGGDVIMMEQMPIFGGYSGGKEETAICDVATMIASFALFDCDIHLDGPIHIRWSTTTTRETLQIAAHACAALDKNTDLLLANQYYSLAGPCTEMCLLEVAAQAMTDTASGRELISGVASSKGVMQDKTTGMEARMMGEVAQSAAGWEVEEINKVLDKLVGLYERDFSHAPAGKRFQECYDLDSITPSNEYLAIFDRAKRTIGRCGLEMDRF